MLSVNVSAARTVEIDGKPVSTGIFKTPVAGRVALRGVNLAGDEQADRTVHGGPDRAVYAYADEDYAWWSKHIGRELAAGSFGENLTLHGIDVSGARIGERWEVGTTVVQVASPRVPCFKLAKAMNDPTFVKAFADALRPGAYLRVIAEGDIGAGDRVAVQSRPEHDLTIAEMARLYFFDRPHVAKMLVASDLPESWRAWAHEHQR